ncbi:Type 1 glutamine amidotransferase-like domain-containing protein [Bacillus sp. PS06]|uniref:Type 1 glutamine amidotransferase-like domain-containing protein n=1 Tax=Bacillus sp. PS06 TaxID=2764176 RepID=UPI001785BBC3|nr:Type 1 glutamine amidotransferase-like domain-containing protein [Bacillus sp. PS06]MBD8071568.1 Type 1 glutamine amidotransferase-like domain-containing protein [Bacillus sp. PS06]
MGKILFTSSGLSTNSIKEKFLELLIDSPTNLKVGIITTASDKKADNKYARRARTDFLAMGFNKVEFIDVEFDDIERLEECNVIYINGGNPFYLLYHLKNSGADKKLKALSEGNVILIGVSAGAVILGPDISIVDFFTPHLNTVNLKDLTGLKITDNIVFPHYDREDLFPSSLSIEERILKYEAVYQKKVLRIADDDAI